MQTGFLKFWENPFAHSILLVYQILLKLCTQHDSIIAVLCTFFVKRFDKVFNCDQLHIFDSQDTIQMAHMSKWFTKIVHKIPAASNGMNMGLI